MIKRTWFFLITVFTISIFSACVDQDFDEPPVIGEDPNLPNPEQTIADLKGLFQPNQLVTIEEDWTIDGIVVADDRSGNFFRSIILQDETGGIEILINLTDAYNFYPIGRQLFIKLKGLVIGEDAGVLQLGGYIFVENGGENLGDIVALDDHILRGQIVGAPEPKTTTINALSNADISSLVKLENVEFAGFEFGQTYSDPIGRNNINRTIQDCNGNEIVMRSSGFANFAGEPIPEGNGSIIAIYSVFRTTPQLFIRQLSDVQMDGIRCSGLTGDETQMSIKDLRDLFNAGTIAAPADRKIVGTVISDRANDNTDGRNLFIQDASGGIVIRFQNFHNFALGDEIEVVVSNQELSEFSGLLQVNRVPNENAKSTGNSGTITPRETTVADILANLEAWESTLVKLSGATITGSSTFGGSTTVADASGSIAMFTRNQATFANDVVPSGEVEIIAIVSEFNTPQIFIRNASDVTGGMMGGGGEATQMAISDVRDLFEDGITAAPADRKIRGVVISDKDNENWTGRNVVIQDGSAGIVVRFTADHEFALGEEVEVVVSGQELSEFRGLLQINNVPNSNANSFGNGMTITPRTATIDEILQNAEAWESTLVKIANVTYTEGGTYSGAKNISDGTGTISAFTRSQASFADSAVPTAAVTMTAVVSQFNDPQLNIRNTSDIE